MSKTAFFVVNLSILLALALSGCSSSPPVKTQAYAQLQSERTFENEFPTVWKAIEETLRNYKVTSRSPENVDPLEMKKLTQRKLETDWVYTKSNDKYHEYKVNGFPRKVYLQSRIRYFLEAKRVMGGVNLKIKSEEEVEKLKDNGTPDGYSRVENPDSARVNDLLNRIQNAILSAPPTSSEG